MPNSGSALDRRPRKGSRPAETTSLTTAVPVGALIPQPHGGALRNGGTNKGGPGRPPDELRARLREYGWERLPDLLDDWEDMDADQRTNLMDRVILKYGIGTQREILNKEEAKANLVQTLEVLQQHLAPEAFTVVLARLEAIWT